jgi:Glycosyltransferase family 87
MQPRVLLAGRLALYCGLALAAWGYYAYEWRSIANFVRQTDHCQLLFCDFVHVYYPQAQEIGDSTQPVDGFLYSAMFGWVLAPVGKLAPDTALTVWGVFQVALTTMMVLPLSWLFLRGAERFWWRLGYFGLALTSIPVFHNFKWGQVSVLVTVCVIMAAFVQRGRAASALAGFLVAFAAAIKFYPAVFLLMFLFRKQWLALASAVVMFVVLFALPMWPMGYDRFKSFSTAKLVTVIEKEVVEDPNSQYVVRVLAADFPSIFDTKNAIAVLKPAGRAVAVLNILLVFGTGLIRMPEESKCRLMICLLFLMLPFVLTTSWMHYLVYLPFCQICLPYEATRLLRDDKRWRMVTVCVLAGVSAVLSSIPMVRRQTDWIAYVTPGFGFYANLAALLAAYVVFTGFMTWPLVSTTSDQPRFP